jgi:PAS domain-containing protein
MSEKRVEVILMRQLAGYLATPMLVVDPVGTLLFFNEPAELVLGKRFDEVGELPASAWSTVFAPSDTDGAPLPPEEFPLLVALARRSHAQRAFWIRGMDGQRRHIEVAAFPLIGFEGTALGAVATLWESKPTLKRGGPTLKRDRP